MLFDGVYRIGSYTAAPLNQGSVLHMEMLGITRSLGMKDNVLECPEKFSDLMRSVSASLTSTMNFVGIPKLSNLFFKLSLFQRCHILYSRGVCKLKHSVVITIEVMFCRTDMQQSII